jgi:hypothetical protein
MLALVGAERDFLAAGAAGGGYALRSQGERHEQQQDYVMDFLHSHRLVFYSLQIYIIFLFFCRHTAHFYMKCRVFYI